jgi:hypothetical protein
MPTTKAATTGAIAMEENIFIRHLENRAVEDIAIEARLLRHGGLKPALLPRAADYTLIQASSASAER